LITLLSNEMKPETNIKIGIFAFIFIIPPIFEFFPRYSQTSWLVDLGINQSDYFLRFILSYPFFWILFGVIYLISKIIKP
jgi:hypothetical protein